MAGCSKSADDGTRPGMPPAQETPEQYIERINKSDLPEDEKKATIEQFEQRRKMVEQNAPAAGSAKPGP